MKKIADKNISIFFGVIACSFMPHWSCHYYRIETGSSFIVAEWEFSVRESYISMGVYTALILLSLLAIKIQSLRVFTSLLAGVLHLSLGVVHIARLIDPFKFEIFNLSWSLGASLREVLFVTPFGILCLVLSLLLARNRI